MNAMQDCFESLDQNLMIIYIFVSRLFNDGLVMVVRMAEWSKAPDLSSGTLASAWVRTPLLTVDFFLPF